MLRRVLMVNPSLEVVVLPSFLCVGYFVPVSAVSVGCTESVSPEEEGGALPDHLKYIIMGSYPSLGEASQDVASGSPTSICACFSGSRGAHDGADDVGTAQDPD